MEGTDGAMLTFFDYLAVAVSTLDPKTDCTMVVANEAALLLTQTTEHYILSFGVAGKQMESEEGDWENE